MGVVLRGETVKILETRIKSEAQDKVKYVSKVLDDEFMDFVKLSTTMHKNTLFSRYYVEKSIANDDLVGKRDIISQLSRIKVSNSMINTVVFHLRGSDVYFTDNNIAKKQYFKSSIMNLSDEYWTQLDTDMESIEHYRIYKSIKIKNAQLSQNEEYITPVLFPVGEVGGYYGTMTYFLDTKALHMLLDDGVLDYVKNVILVDDEEKLITAVNDDSVFFESSGNYEDDKFLIFSATVEITGWKVCFVIDKTEILKDVSNFKRIIFLSVCLILLIGAVILLFFIKRSYSPIMKMNRRIKDMSMLDVEDRGDELEMIDFALSNLSNHAEKLKKSLNEFKPYVKKQILQDMLTMDKAAPLNADDMSVSLFERDMYGVIIWEFASDSELKKKVEQVLEEYVLENNIEYYSIDITADAEVFVVALERKQKNVLSELELETLVPGTSVYMGEYYRNVIDLSKSYMTAIQKYNYVHNKFEKEETYPYKKIGELNHALKNHNLSDSMLIAEDVMNSMDDGMPAFFVRCIALDILMNFLGSLLENQFINTKIRDLCIKMIEQIKSENEVCRIKSSTIKIFREVIEQTNDSFKKKDDFVNQVVDYVNENCFSQDFSLKMMTSKFQVSSSYLSLMFKNSIGKNISEYVWDLRLMKAKELLLETDELVANIAADVGYPIANSFIRKFKETEGMSPSEWRNKNFKK